MADDADPPRQFYGFKPREFDRVNAPASAATPAPAQPTADPGIVPVTSERVDVRDLARLANAEVPLLGNNAPKNRANEVHQVLRENYERDQAAGLFHVEPTVDKKRRRRIRNYWLGLVVVDGGLGFVAWQVGPAAAIPFACAIGGIGMFTAVLTWWTWFLRTE